MPAPVIEDRSLAKSLYLEGLSVKEVAQNLGVNLSTVASWKFRDKWDESPRKEAQAKTVAIQAVAEEFANYTLTLSRKILCKLNASKLTDIRDCKEAATALQAAYATARKALGLDDARSAVITVSLLSAPERANPILDIQATTTPTDTPTGSVLEPERKGNPDDPETGAAAEPVAQG